MAKRRKTVRERLDAATRAVPRWRGSIQRAQRDLAKAEAAGNEKRVEGLRGRIERSTKLLQTAMSRLERLTESLPADLKREKMTATARRGALKLAERVMSTPAPKAAPRGPSTAEKVKAVSIALDLRGREFRDARRRAAMEPNGRPGEAREQTADAHRLVQADRLEIGDNRVVRVTQSPIEVLSARKVISERQTEAAKRLLSDWFMAGLSPVGSVDPNRAGGGGGSRWAPGQMPLTESQAIARAHWRDAVRAIGAEMAVIVVAVVIESEVTGEKLDSMAQRITGRASANEARAGLVTALKIGLDMLASHYRIPDHAKKIRGYFTEKPGVREELWGPVEDALANHAE